MAKAILGRTALRRAGPWRARLWRRCHRWTGRCRRRGLALGLALALPIALGACLDARTRGDEPPDEIVIQGTPTWANGMEALMRLKCGVCHRVPAGPVSPKTIPTNFDLNYHTARPDGILGAQEVLPNIQLQVGQGTMPKEYATPLTAGERQAILAWDGS